MDNLPKANRDVSVKLVDRNYLTNIFQKFDLVFNVLYIYIYIFIYIYIYIN